ncbi:hypothetical protein [Paractinoplanes hotanensis]|uniref:Uncharacterized protein n=1 Tax=Paractinoplanes hotanensis TaxID=2906497 RepID=A0ABT0XXR0_9ACTN|nr:hypothetical protein [Actinoplanes hotanensis]MCM4078568.1 hypothetical protein [Actinoplanes hotanensis]
MFYARLYARRFFCAPLPDVPEFDAERAMTDRVLQEAQHLVRRGNWQAARDTIEEAGDNWELRGRRIAAFGDLAVVDDSWLYAWLRAEPSDPAAVLLQAATLRTRAGKARGGASAANTTAEQFADHHALSTAAAEVGRRAMAFAAPNDPVPWAQVLDTMFGDHQTRESSFDEVFDEGRRRDPYNFDLHLTAMSLHCQKWFGSHELMFATARKVASSAPPGANVLLLPLLAHIEYAMREFSWGENAKDNKSLKRCRKYFHRAQVQQEMDHWIAKWRAGIPNPGRLTTCLHWLAIYYTMSGRQKEAKAVFDELGPYVVPAVAWAFFYPDREYGYLTSWWWANGIH